LHDLKNFRAYSESKPWWASWSFYSMSFWGFGKGTLEFDYGLKTVKFAGDIDELEAKHLVDLFRSRGITT